MQSIDTTSTPHNRSSPRISTQLPPLFSSSPSTDQPLVAMSSTPRTFQPNMPTASTTPSLLPLVNPSSSDKPPAPAVTAQSPVDSHLVHSASPAAAVHLHDTQSPQTMATQNATPTSVSAARHIHSARQGPRDIPTISSLSAHQQNYSAPMRPSPLTDLLIHTTQQLPVLSQRPLNRPISSDHYTLFSRGAGIPRSHHTSLPAPSTIQPPLFSHQGDAYGRNFPTSRMPVIPPATSQHPPVSTSPPLPTTFNVPLSHTAPYRHDPVTARPPPQLPHSTQKNVYSHAYPDLGRPLLPPAIQRPQHGPASSAAINTIRFPRSNFPPTTDLFGITPVPREGIPSGPQRVPNFPNQHNRGRTVDTVTAITASSQDIAFARDSIGAPSSSLALDIRGGPTSAHPRFNVPELLNSSHPLNVTRIHRNVDEINGPLQAFPPTGNQQHPHHPIPSAVHDRVRTTFAPAAPPAFHIGSQRRQDNRYQQRPRRPYGQASSSRNPTPSESPSSVVIGTHNKTIVEDDGFLYQRILVLEEKVGQSSELAALIRRTDETIQSMSGLAGELWKGPIMQTVDIRSKYPLAPEDIDTLLDDATSLAQTLYNKLRGYCLAKLHELRDNAVMAENALEKRLDRQRSFRPIPVAEVERRMQYVSQKFTRVREAIVEQMKDYIKNIKWVEVSPSRVRRGSLNTHQNHTLRLWLFENFADPYPTTADKQMLILQTGLTLSQVNNWFINARVRVWKPPVDAVRMKRNAEESLKTIKEGKERRRQENARMQGRLHLGLNATGSAVSDVEGGTQQVGSLLPGTRALRIAASTSDHHQHYRNSGPVQQNQSRMPAPLGDRIAWPLGAREAQMHGMNVAGPRAAHVASSSAIGVEYGSNRPTQPAPQNNEGIPDFPASHQQQGERAVFRTRSNANWNV